MCCFHFHDVYKIFINIIILLLYVFFCLPRLLVACAPSKKKKCGEALPASGPYKMAGPWKETPVLEGTAANLAVPVPGAV